MKLEAQLADRVATLARLRLTPKERATFSRQLAALLEHFEQLQRVDTSEIEPTAQVVAQAAPAVARRADARGAGPLPLSADALLARAPEQRDGLFLVPRVID